MTEKKARKPYRGDGVTVPAVTPLFLPPEPVGEHVTVRVYGWHPVYGSLPIFDRMVSGWMPHGWIGDPLSWRDLCRLGGGQAPTVLEPREVTP